MARSEQEVQQDPAWAHLSSFDAARRRVKCNWCGKVMAGGVTRGKEHLAGIIGQVKKCDKCPKEVSIQMRDILLGRRAVKERRAEEEVELREEISGRRDRKGKGISVGGVSIRERGDPIYRPENSSDEEAEDSDPELTAARKESMYSLHEDEARRQGAGTSGTRTKTGTYGSTAGTHTRTAAGSHAGGGYDPQQVGSMDTFVHRRRTAAQPKIKQALRGVKKSAEAATHAIRSIVKWIVHANIPAHAVESPYFQGMCDAIGEYGTGLKAPSRRDIYGSGLDDEYAEIQEWVNSFKTVWRERGCTIMCDGWTGTTKKAMINFLVYCTEGTIFMKSIDASNFSKNATYLFNLMDQIVQEIGEENVVQVVTDNEASYKAAGRKLMEKRKQLYWVPCAAHSLDLMLEDIGKDKYVKQTVQQAQKVTQFIYSHPRILNMMRENATGGRDLIRAGPTRFASNFVSLESLLRYRNDLKSFVSSKEFLAYVDKLGVDGQLDALDMIRIVEDKKFWDHVSQYLRLVEPLVQVLRMVDGDDKNDMGYLYQAMDAAKELIKQKSPKSFQKWWKIIDQRWESTLHHDLHTAGYYLNPRFQYSRERSIEAHGAVLQGTLNVIRRISRSMADKVEAERQMESFRLMTGTYSEEALQYAIGRVSPAEWWVMVNNRDNGLNPLAYVAIRVLSQTTSSSQCERNWSTFSLIHSKIRNRLKTERLEKLVFCHYNMRLRLKNIKLKQQLREKLAMQAGRQSFAMEEPTGQIDVDALFDNDHPLQSWVEVRDELDEPLFDPADTDWSEGILRGDTPRDPEFKTPKTKRPREAPAGPSTSATAEVVPDTQLEMEPARLSESDSRPVTPRMTGPPPFLRRTSSGITGIQRTSATARDDPAIDQLKQIYVRHTPGTPRGKSVMEKLREQDELEAKRKQEERPKRKSRVRKKLVIYETDDDDGDDDSGTATGAAAGATVGGSAAPSFSLHSDTGAGYSQGQGDSQQGHGGPQSDYGGGQHQAGMYGWGYEHQGFQFDPTSTYGSSSSTSYTPREIQSQMDDLAASLFGYSAYREYMQPGFTYGQDQTEEESENSSRYPYQ